MRLARATLSLMFLGLPLACQKKEAPKPVEPPKTEAKVEAPAKAPSTLADPACITPWSAEGAPTPITIAGRTFDKVGTQLVETSKDDNTDAVIGVLANLKEDTADNLKNIEVALAFFKKEGVDTIVVDGDSGESQSQIEATLGAVAAANLPTLVLIGNREKRSDFNAALTALSSKHPHLVHLGQVRLVAMDDVAFVSVPGYHDRAYIHAEDGCQYTASDLEATAPAIKAAGARPVVLVSHGAPKQDGVEALDRTLEQANVGDEALTSFISAQGIKFGIFGNIQEAGGRATDLSGKRRIAAEKPESELYLNPGPVDSVSWQMNDGTRAEGMAAVMKIQGGQASFKVQRLREVK